MSEKQTVKDFPLGHILSITHDRLVARNHMSGVYEILNFMTDDDLMTHALPRAADECKPSLLEQHPDLLEIVVPDDLDENNWITWLDGVEAKYGESRPVERLPKEDHTVIDPIAEIKMMRPDLLVIAVVDEPSGSGEER